jgi:protein disulfide-isomerase
MKKLSLTLMAGLLATQLTAAELHWLTDVSAAQAKAKKENKLVMLDFTGSDWCGWCIKLKKEVFDTKEFADYAKDNLVLVEVDFPRKKKLDAKQEKANETLMEKYKVKGFPTLVLLNADGKQVGELGYESSPKPFIAKIDQARKK